MLETGTLVAGGETMPRTVTVGLDGSPESRAAAEWAAREAQLLRLPVKLVHVREPVSEPMALVQLLGAEAHEHWSEKMCHEALEGLGLCRGVGPPRMPGRRTDRCAAPLAANVSGHRGRRAAALRQRCRAVDQGIPGSVPAHRRPACTSNPSVPHIGHVTHAVLHHAAAPGAVVPHG
nr:universal stress protein [Streptomyces sp. MK5]